MKQVTVATKPSATTSFRLAYFLYLVLVVYQLFIGDYEWAITNFGIAMVFDPFDASVNFNDKPLFQKLWLYAHLTLSLSGFAFLLFL
jgi:hypothetical protein